MEQSTIFALVKIVERPEYARSLLRGELYMNSLAYFREYEDHKGELRGDDWDGLGAIWQPRQISEISVGDLRIPPNELAGPILFRHSRLDYTNVFCTYSLDSRSFDSVPSQTTLAELRRAMLIDPSVHSLGAVAVLITNVTEFFKRVDSAIKSKSLSSRRGLISYFDEVTFHGDFGDKAGFYKRKAYSDQREYRVTIESQERSTGAYILSVGDLSDVAVVTTPEEVNRELKLTLPDGSTAGC